MLLTTFHSHFTTCYHLSFLLCSSLNTTPPLTPTSSDLNSGDIENRLDVPDEVLLLDGRQLRRHHRWSHDLPSARRPTATTSTSRSHMVGTKQLHQRRMAPDANSTRIKISLHGNMRSVVVVVVVVVSTHK